MVIGMCQLALHLPDNGSLKGKRKVIKSIVTRIRGKFNVAISEINDHDLWQSAHLGVVTVGNDRTIVNSILNKTSDLIESMGLAEVLEIKMDILNI